MAGEVKGAAENNPHTKKRSLSFLFSKYWPLWPTIIGLVFARCGILVGSYGSYASTDQGLFTDGATLISMSVLLIPLLFIGITHFYLGKRRINIIMYLSVFLQAISLTAYALMLFSGDESQAIRFALSVLNQVSGISTLCYWLRRCRGASSSTAALCVFGALAISELLLYIASLMEEMPSLILMAGFVLLQLPMMLAARKRPNPFEIKSRTLKGGWLGSYGNHVSNGRFLMATGLGIAFLSVAIGLLRGYPEGEAITFTPATRVAYMLLTIGLCLYLYMQVRRGRNNALTVTTWIIMQLLAMTALLFYVMFPEYLQFGAVFATTLNALMVGFVWYVMISFMTFGWRCPYYYCLAGFMMFLVPRALARMTLLSPLNPVIPDIVIALIIGIVVLISAQFLFVQYFGALRESMLEQADRLKTMTYLHDRDVEELAKLSTEKQVTVAAAKPIRLSAAETKKPREATRLERLMGLNEESAMEGGLTGFRQVTMQKSAEELGKQFLLSDREVEVVTLYALGYTQKRVAEELFISPGTVHAHMKRIYSKTGLHSRQEILDYLQQYAS